MKKEYLKNEICNFTLLKKNSYDINKNKNIYSTGLFKIDKPYKSFNKYLKGLDNWINYLEKNSPKDNYVLRIFIDESIFEDKGIMRKLNSCKYIEPVLFNCPNFKSKNNKKYHLGLFGTLTRFFPAFDFENNDTKNIISVDIDFGDLKMDFEIIEILKKNKKKFKNSLAGLIELKRYFDKRSNYPHLNAFLYFGKKLNKKYIIDYLNGTKIKNRTTKFLSRNIKNYEYGVDEIFLNNYLDNDISEINGIYYFNLNRFINRYQEQLKNKNSLHYFKIIFGKYFKNDKIENIIEKFNNLISKENLEDNKNKIKLKYILTNFYELIKKLVKDKREWLPMRFMKFILHKNINGIIYGIIFIKVDLINKTLKPTIYNAFLVKNI